MGFAECNSYLVNASVFFRQLYGWSLESFHRVWAVSSLNNLTSRAGSVQLIHLNYEETVERLRIKKKIHRMVLS